MASVFTV